MNIRHLAVEAWDRLRHRSVAALLAVAMTLSLLPATSWATSPITPPTQIIEATKSEFPKIEFQTNFVRTSYGSLTGLMELAIRVGPSEKDVDGKPIPVNFQSVAATLQYNTTLFQPISWQWAFGEMGEVNQPVLKLDATSYYDVQLPAKKDDTLPGTGAIAQCGIVNPAPTGMSTNVTSGEQALLFFKAEAYGPAITIAEMTTLAVVRFYVDPALMEHISLLRNKETGEYSVLFDGEKTEANWITNQAKLDAAIKTVATLTSPVTPDPDPAPSARDTTTLTLPTDFISVGFAMDGDMARSQSPADMSLHYSTGGNEFYYVPGCDPTEPDPDKNDKLVKVPTELGPKDDQDTVDLPAPKTEGSLVLAVKDGAVTDSKNAADYSYLSNLIPGKNISFPVVSEVSFADNGDGRENMATILFYDWDDTLIGVLVVPRNDDARALVNEYVRDNMIHPDLRFTVGSTTQTTDITSLARKDTYRGKYPSTPMGENGKDTTMDGNRPATPEGNDKLVGSDYPLTNKLDYVFLKRPMVKDETAVDSDGNPTNTWKQLGDETAAEWDDEYPYIHGWALIPDKDLTDIQYTHPKNLWTTMGTAGELNSYTGFETIRNPSTAAQTKNVIQATVTSTDEDFAFADFDFSEKNLKVGTVYAVKAVYEPGLDLMGRVAYRMISQPYYDKLNERKSSGGAAFSVDMAFERSIIDEGTLYGVTRARELMLRQETTSDIRWEGEDLANASILDQNNKTKTTYTNVTVENIDVVDIQLVLSARQNKVDYYLMEGYGASFVTGGERSTTNASFAGERHVVDNYNYRVDDSDLGDIYYDTPYADRDGSHGFVLYGTLNNILRITSQYILDGKKDISAFNTYVTEDTLRDVNLRLPTNAFASADDDLTSYLKMMEAVRAAVEAAVTAHLAKDDTWWNPDPERDWASMTYHQMQHFISDYIQNGSATLMTESAADAKSISWCHYHEECAAKASGKPRNWEELIRRAQGFGASGEPVDPKEKLTLLTMEEAEEIAHIRMDGGQPFASIGDFADKFIAAVQAGNTTWDQIQDHIIRGQNDAAWSQAHYWWYDGATYVPLNSLSDTVAAAKDAYTPVKAPGDSTAVCRTAKINQLETVFEANRLSPTVTADWNAATRNLCAGDQGDKFADFDTFRNKFVAAAEAVVTAVGKLEFDSTDTAVTIAAKTRNYWNQLQYYILHDSYSPSDPEMEGYWWYDGNSKIGDLASLLEAAQRQVDLDAAGGGGKDIIFDLFTLSDLYSLTDLRFRRNFHGDKFTDVDDFKDAVKMFVQLSGINKITAGATPMQKTRCWNQLQYWLIHQPDSTDIVNKADAEKEYYWWRDDEDGVVYTLTINTTNAGVATLMEAIYRFEANGNPKAYDQLNAAAMAGFKLAPSYSTETTWSAFERYGDESTDLHPMSDLKTGTVKSLRALYNSIPAGTDYKTITWRQIQHYLLTGVYLPEGDSNLPSDSPSDENGYWWRDTNDKPTAGGETKTDLQYFLEAMDKYIADGVAADLDAAVTQYIFSGKLGFHGGTKRSHKLIETVTNNTHKSNARKVVPALAETIKEMMKADPSIKSSADVLDWYILQYYMINDINSKYTAGNPIADHATAMAYYLKDLKGNWIPEEYKGAEASESMLSMMAMPQTVVEEDPDTGRITTTSPDAITELPGGLVQIQRTITVLSPEGEILSVTTLVEIYDADYNLISSQTVTMPTPETEEPICTCGSEDDTHAENCPLYVAPEEPVCICGREDGTHAEDCPLYVAPEEPVCICGSEDGVHAENCPLYVAPEAPVESPEVTELPEPSESAEPTPPPQPAETEPPQEELPQPSVPGSEEPEVMPTPEVMPAPEPTPTLEPTPTPEPTESREPEYTIETMPEVVDPVPEDIFEDDPTEEADAETVTSADPPETEVTVVETLPPLGIPRMIQTRSATMDYRKLTTKIVKTKSLTSAGGMKMKQLKLKRIISPPGQMGIPLLLRADTMERRSAV